MYAKGMMRQLNSSRDWTFGWILVFSTGSFIKFYFNEVDQLPPGQNQKKMKVKKGTKNKKHFNEI